MKKKILILTMVVLLLSQLTSYAKVTTTSKQVKVFITGSHSIYATYIPGKGWSNWRIDGYTTIYGLDYESEGYTGGLVLVDYISVDKTIPTYQFPKNPIPNVEYKLLEEHIKNIYIGTVTKEEN